MSDTNSNQPAFPIQTDILNDAENDMQVIKGSHGLTKREYAVIKTIQGLLAGEYYNLYDEEAIEKLIEKSIKITDSLLKQLESKQQ